MLTISNIDCLATLPMSNQHTVYAGIIGSEIELGGSSYKSFNEIELDDNWEKIGHDVNPNIVRYKATKHDSKLALRIFNIKKPEILRFEKNAKIKLSTKVLKFQNKDLINRSSKL